MRSFVCFFVAALVLVPSSSPAQQPLTARDIVEQIKQNIGVPWTEPTVDTFKDGDPVTPVTGVAVTMMATFDVLQRAASRGANLVITHEPTFYDHFDKLDVLEAEHDSRDRGEARVHPRASYGGGAHARSLASLGAEVKTALALLLPSILPAQTAYYRHAVFDNSLQRDYYWNSSATTGRTRSRWR